MIVQEFLPRGNLKHFLTVGIYCTYCFLFYNNTKYVCMFRAIYKLRKLLKRAEHILYYS